jgi:hypothetical protein
MENRAMRLTLLIVLTAGMIPTLAQAEPGAGRGACLRDIKTICAGVQPGGGRIRNCIREHRAELSQECKAAIAERLTARRQNRQGGPGGSAGDAKPDEL